MKLWSSMNYFTDKFPKIFDLCTLDVQTQKKEQDRVGLYCRRCHELDLEKIDSEPLHDNDRYFIQLFNQFYESYTPGFVIQKDFSKRGLHLNLYGDIVVSPDVISVFSPRYFGGFKRESLMFYNIQDLAGDAKCGVINQTFMLSEQSAVCKIYMAQKMGKGEKAERGMILRSSKKEENEEENPGILKKMFPKLQDIVPALLSYDNPFACSETLCKTLGIIEAGPKYESQLEEEAKYVKTERLFDIYQRRIDAQTSRKVPTDP